MNAQGLSFVNDEEEALPTLDLPLPLPITPPRLPVELQDKALPVLLLARSYLSEWRAESRRCPASCPILKPS